VWRRRWLTLAFAEQGKRFLSEKRNNKAKNNRPLTRARRPATLSDIALEAGVSKMSVSRAINNLPKISAETRERVLKVARRLNYQPNRYARALMTNRSYLIGIVVPDLTHSFFAEMSRGIESRTRVAGYQNLMCNTDEDPVLEIKEVSALLSHTDGLIIATALAPTDTKFYRKIIRDGANIVLVDRYLNGVRCPVFRTDDVMAGMLGAEHLIKLGHRRIGYLCGVRTSNALDRFLGYQQALKKHKLPFDPSLVRLSGFPYEPTGYEVVANWIREGNMPTAVLAFSDPAAIGAMRAATDAGLRVPDDLAIVGCGRIHYLDLLRVPLTTVTWPPIGIGGAAADRLIEMIKGKRGETRSAGETIFTPALVVRASSGAPVNELTAMSGPERMLKRG
jgi:LacI family transcriptional regulator